jgi:Family of unknown function (DUF6515)
MDTRTRRTLLALALFACAGATHAQGRFDRGRVEHERARYATPHWVYDDRFHHNRYYPARGYVVDVLPPGNVAIAFRGAPFWYHSGVWYQRSGPRYVVVQPPLGVIVPALPPGYTVVYNGGMPYYYANDVYYVQQPTGYEVVAPAAAAPGVAVAAQPPAPAPQPPAVTPGAQTSGTWYYCDSAKGYYPYVTQCAEGWRSVPASPPPGAPR